MIIAIVGCQFCDNRISVENIEDDDFLEYLDFKQDPKNLYDKNAVECLYKDEKIGFVSKNDNVEFWKFFNSKDEFSLGVTTITKEPDSNMVRYFQLEID